MVRFFQCRELKRPPLRRKRWRGVVDWATTYCEVLDEIGMMTKAAKAAGVTLRAVQLRRKTDAAFVEQERDALEVLRDMLESEAIRRAEEGVRHEHYDRNGRLVYVETKYSDTLLLRLLEKCDPTWRRDYHPPEQPASAGLVFHTRAERKAALDAELAWQAAICAPA